MVLKINEEENKTTENLKLTKGTKITLGILLAIVIGVLIIVGINIHKNDIETQETTKIYENNIEDYYNDLIKSENNNITFIDRTNRKYIIKLIDEKLSIETMSKENLNFYNVELTEENIKRYLDFLNIDYIKLHEQITKGKDDEIIDKSEDEKKEGK